MNTRTRLETAFHLQQPDRPPILGGWLAAPNHIQALTGCTDDEYWADPFHWGVAAEQVLGSDGAVTIFVPVSRGEFRCVDGQVLAERQAYTLEGVLAEVEALPSRAELEAAFDEEQEYPTFAAEHAACQAQCGAVTWCPADWWIIPKALWYHEYGYENALTVAVAYPEHERRLIETSAVRGRQRATLVARCIREGILPAGLLTGEDLCGQQGPMVSPAFLRREYWPWVEYALEPLLAAGAKIVWHCDGNYRPLLPDVLACGVAGLQGFQTECGMSLDWIVDLKTRTNDPLLIFGAMSVTRTLPYGTPDDIRADVRRTMEICRDRAGLVFFTSNTITPDVPLENVRAFWDAVLESRW